MAAAAPGSRPPPWPAWGSSLDLLPLLAPARTRRDLVAALSSADATPKPIIPGSTAPNAPTGSSAAAVAPSAKTAAPAGDKAKSSHLAEYFVAGGMAGAASRTVVSPLERVKIIFQVQGPGMANYQGLWASLVKIGKTEGWRGYFRGNGINVVRIAPYSAIQFTSYETAKKVLSRFAPGGPGSDLTTPLRLLAGAMAGICSVVSTYPLDLVRSRLSIISASIGDRPPTLKGKELGMWGMTVKVYRDEGGVRALYRGLVPTAVGVAPYVGLNFAGFEFFKRYFTPPGRKPSVLRKLGCGALAGAFSQSVTYPLDVLRRRMQVVGMSDVGFKYNGAIHATSVILKTEGIRGLYKGLWPNLLKVAPSIGTSFVVYEFTRDSLLSLQ